MKKIIKRILVCLGVAFILGIAGCFYSITREPWIEWDEYDSELHGQEVIFTEPMVYESVDPIYYYGSNDIKIKLILSSRKNAKSDLQHNFSLQTEDVRNGMRFTVVQSFWKRKNWWESAFAAESRSLVLQDEQGAQVISSFYNLVESNRADLFELRDVGY